MDLLKKSLPHIVAVLIFAVISSVFFSPVFSDYALRQGDIKNFLGMSKEIRDFREVFGEEPLYTNSAFGGMPAYQISVEHKSNLLKKVDRIYSLFLPRPVDAMFIAMLGFYILMMCMRINPWLAIAGSIAFGLASFNILYLGAGHVSKIKAVAYMAPVLGGFLLTYRGKWLLGGAVTALFLGLHITANHLQMTYYLLFLLVFAGIGEAIRMIRAGETSQFAKRTGVLILAGIMGILPSMSNLATTSEYSKYTTRGETELTITPPGKAEENVNTDGLDWDYILQYSMARGEFWSFAIPNAKGGQTGSIGSDREAIKTVDRDYREAVSQQNRYWGRQYYTGGAFYYGAMIIFLFLMGMIFLKQQEFKWPLFALIILAINLSWRDASPIGEFFLEKVPLYSKFRDTKMILVNAMIIIPLIAMLFLDQIFKAELDKKLKRNLLIAGGSIVLVFVVLWSAPTSFLDFTTDDEIASFNEYLESPDMPAGQETFIYGMMDSIEQARVAIFQSDAIRTIMFMLLCFAILIAAVFTKLDKRLVIGLLGVFFLADLWTVDRRYLDNENLKRSQHWVESWEAKHPFETSEADKAILQMEQVLNRDLTDDIAKAQNEADIPKGKRFAKLSERKSDEIAFRELGFSSNYRVLNMGNPFNEAGTSFFHKSLGGYHGAKLKRYNEVIDFHIMPEITEFSTQASSKGILGAFADLNVINMLNTKYLIHNPGSPPIVNPSALGNAWFVSDIKWAKSADEEIQSLANFNPGSEVVIDERFKDQVNNISSIDSLAIVDLVSYLPNHLQYEYSSDEPGYLVFSEIYYPEGWQAYIDDQPAEYQRVNYLLRGLNVPSGDHSVSFKFEPSSYPINAGISLIGSILVILLLLGALYKSFRTIKEQE